MKFDNMAMSPVQTEGVRAQASFEVEFGPHMMMILSKLYTDPLWAIVREYGTNMLDAYAKLPPTREFRAPIIHLPNKLEPYIEFRDFGVGMPFDVVWNTFRKYGASTKRDNNLEVGGLGLGCKSAFAYAGIDPWTVESRYDGELMIFTAHRAPDGTPTFVHVETIPTDEENGVTIRIPLEEKDWRKITESVKKLLRYFPIECHVVGALDFTWEKPTYRVSGNGWGINDADRSWGSTVEWQAIMGNVAYPINPAALDNFKPEYHLDLYLPIGSVSIVPSRDALEYNEQTIATLKQAHEKVLAELRDLVEAQMSDIPTMWEALQFMHDAWGIPSLRERLKKARWKGRLLDATAGLTVPAVALKRKFPNITSIIRYDTERGSKFNFSEHDLLEPAVTGYVDNAAGEKVPVYRRSQRKLQFTPYDQVKKAVFVDTRPPEERKRVRTAIRAWLQDTVCTNTGYRRARNYTQHNTQNFIIAGEGLDPAEISKFLRGYSVRNFEAVLPQVKLAENKVRAREKVKLERWTGHQFSKEETVDVDKGGYFIRKERSDYSISVPSNVRTLWKLALAEGYVTANDQLYAIPRTLQRIEKKAGWVDFREFMVKQVNKKWSRIKRKVYLHDLYVNCHRDDIFRAFSKYDPATLPKDIRDCMRKITSAKDVSKDVTEWHQYARILSIGDVLVSPDTTEWQDIINRYPMLRLLNESGYGVYARMVANKEVITHYLKQCEAERASAAPEQVVQLTA